MYSSLDTTTRDTFTSGIDERISSVNLFEHYLANWVGFFIVVDPLSWQRRGYDHKKGLLHINFYW
jgi:hypothetical protein